MHAGKLTHVHPSTLIHAVSTMYSHSNELYTATHTQSVVVLRGVPDTVLWTALSH